MSARTKPITTEEKAFWSNIRKQFYLKDDVTYLQGGSVGPSPKPVIERVIELLKQVEEDPFYNNRWELMHPLVEASREKVAEFVGAPAKCISLVTNTTMGMNIPAQGLYLQPGSEILMSDQEYPSVQSMWDFMARQQNVTVRKVPLPTPPKTPQDIVDAYAAHITPRTQVMIFSHVYCTTGLAAPVKALSDLARENGAYSIVDGAHAVGMVPVNIEEFGCDFYASSTHKWLLAPKGTGIMYIAPHFLSTLRAPILGYNVNSHAHASRFDVTGTADHTHFAGLKTAIDYQLDIGWEDKIVPYSNSLAKYLKEVVLDEIEGAYLTIPDDPAMSGFLTSFAIEGVNLHPIREIMWNEYKIQIATTGAGGEPCFRISTHFYDSFEDIDRFVDVLKELIATRDELRIDPSEPRRRRK
jgi:isopenicillin-N epimerase